tara:strand:- start:135 stop:695 length:561 start_codon:yes stop_codon:yes gene_type:complete
MHKHLPNIFIFIDQFNKQIFRNNSTNIGVVYRNYNSVNRIKDAIKIAKECKKKNYKLFISNDIKLAIKTKAHGVYIPAFNGRNKFNNLEKRNFIILGSVHNQKEIKQKIEQKCSAIFISPLFKTKKSKKYLGINRFNYLTNSTKINVLALGGINEKNIKQLKMLNVKGFAGIRIFKKKPAYKRPVF